MILFPGSDVYVSDVPCEEGGTTIPDFKGIVTELHVPGGLIGVQGEDGKEHIVPLYCVREAD